MLEYNILSNSAHLCLGNFRFFSPLRIGTQKGVYLGDSSIYASFPWSLSVNTLFSGGQID